MIKDTPTEGPIEYATLGQPRNVTLATRAAVLAANIADGYEPCAHPYCREMATALCTTELRALCATHFADAQLDQRLIRQQAIAATMRRR